jgi:[ribosomal protein S5]-alanine N-acetyltransferase
MLIRLYPVTLSQMQARLAGEGSLAGFAVTEDVIPSVVLALASQALKAGQSPRWRAPCLFVSGVPPVAVGSAAFMGEPVNGRIEVGYGVAPVYAGRGFATAGVRLMVEQALSQPEVEEVYAETAIGNIASKRVMQKIGFTHIGQRESEHDGRVDQWLRSREIGAQ